jgi:hypothetical protein
MIRDAQPARVRELLGTLRSIDEDLIATTSAADLMTCKPGALVLLFVDPIDLDWLNINRPIIAQRALRLVLWTEDSVSDQLKFESPDLHDWVSHFIKCPPGVPRFAVEGLRIGSRWWPGVAWRGTGLELALAELDIEVETLDPDSAFAGLVETLKVNPDKAVRWVGVDSLRKLWRIRWAVAEARHHGLGVLDNPRVSTPGWFPVDSRQHKVQAAWLQPGVVLPPNQDRETISTWTHQTLLAAIGAELETGAVGAVSEEWKSDEVLREVGLLSRPGPRLRAMHESAPVVNWRRSLITEIRERPEHSWSRHELAVFTSLELDQAKWPELINSHSQQRHFVEWILRTDARLGPRAGWIAAAGLDDRELMAHWSEGAQEAFDGVEFGRKTWSPPSREQWSAVGEDDVWGVCSDLGWDSPFCIRSASILLERHLEDSVRIAEITKALQDAVAAELGQTDAAHVEYVYMTNVARALAGNPWQARDEVAELAEHEVQHPGYAKAVYATLRILCGDYQPAVGLLQPPGPDDPLWVRLYLETLLAAGEPERAKAELERILGIDAEPRDYLGTESNVIGLAREFLLARLRAY